MENIRWILLLVGVVIILGIYLFARLKTLSLSVPRRSRPKAGAARRAAEPSVDGFSAEDSLPADIDELGELYPREDSAAAAEPVITARTRSARPSRPEVSPNHVFSLFVLAPHGVPFRGPLLLGALDKAKLEYGDMQIFHRAELIDGKEKTLFSAANIREPGTFDLAAMEHFTTQGLALFMQVRPGVDAVWAFEAMVEAARSLADSLDGTVCDATRSVLTRQTIGHMREAVIGCQLQQRMAKAAS
jgi:cell division protein ZipA